MKTLFLLRHAKASPGGPALDDHERPLAERGVGDCARVGGWLAERATLPEHVLCSSSVRTRDTAERVLACLPSPPPLEVDEALYLASLEALLGRLRALDPALERVLLVGHNPGMQDLVLCLSDGSHPEATARARRKFPTAALAVLRCDVTDWRDLRPGSAALKKIVIPRELS
jgi:phosphohistidine phosphatase